MARLAVVANQPRRPGLQQVGIAVRIGGRIVDKATLMERVWPGVVVGDDSLTQTIVEIRRAIGDGERQVLCTVARRGYRLQALEDARPEDPPAFSIAVLPIADDPDAPESTHWAAALTAELESRTGVDLIGSKVAARETIVAVSELTNDPRVRRAFLACGRSSVANCARAQTVGTWRSR
jgi:hypothetical protein